MVVGTESVRLSLLLQFWDLNIHVLVNIKGFTLLVPSFFYVRVKKGFLCPREKKFPESSSLQFYPVAWRKGLRVYRSCLLLSLRFLQPFTIRLGSFEFLSFKGFLPLFAFCFWLVLPLWRIWGDSRGFLTIFGPLGFFMTEMVCFPFVWFFVLLCLEFQEAINGGFEVTWKEEGAIEVALSSLPNQGQMHKVHCCSSRLKSVDDSYRGVRHWLFGRGIDAPRDLLRRSWDQWSSWPFFVIAWLIVLMIQFWWPREWFSQSNFGDCEIYNREAFFFTILSSRLWFDCDTLISWKLLFSVISFLILCFLGL